VRRSGPIGENRLMAGWLTAEAFESVVVEELDLLPPEMLDGLENVAFVVEDEPEDGEELFGRYDGVDLTSRDRYGYGELPDRIVLFRLPHLAAASTLEELRDEVHTTLVHEIGHYYGLDDERLHTLGWA
jgi:predicted Zn-dependent protease with MMP-like domain